MKRILFLIPVVLLLGILLYFLPQAIAVEQFGFARPVPEAERALRTELVQTAVGWLGADDRDLSHREIINLYNTLDPLPRDYAVTYTDAWCAAFGTAAAMRCGLTDIIPPECSCSRQIAGFRALGRWEEDDNYLPLPGDYIYYDWDLQIAPDCKGSPEHVGIVVGTYGPFLLVMEGNKDGRAEYRKLWRNDYTIRGYGLPDYSMEGSK